jgi:hypothetical protein
MGATVVTKAGSDITGVNSGTNTGDETLATIKSKLGVTTLSGSNTGDMIRIAEVFDSSAPNDIINTAGIQAVAPTTNAHLILSPKGLGGVSVKMPTVLKPLGNNAANFGIGQASGDNSASFGAANATAQYAAAFGFSTASAYGAASFGTSVANGTTSSAFGSATANGYSASAFGGGIADAGYSVSFGGSLGRASPNVTQNKIATSAGDGPMLSGFTPLHVTADEYAPAILSANGIFDVGNWYPSSTFCLPARTSAVFEFIIVARSDNNLHFAAWRVTGVLNVNTISTTTVFGVVVTMIYNPSGWAFNAASVTADTVYGGITITVPEAPAGTLVSWGATIISAEVTS